jgi:hypothetical protein
MLLLPLMHRSRVAAADLLPLTLQELIPLPRCQTASA